MKLRGVLGRYRRRTPRAVRPGLDRRSRERRWEQLREAVTRAGRA